MDASIVAAPKQRNTRDENQSIRDGDIPEDWSENKRRQKDTDARWIQKNGVNQFGYKNHINIDVQHKLIRDYDVTPASTHDSQVFEHLIDPNNSSRDVWADSAYGSAHTQKSLRAKGFRGHIQKKGCRYKKLSPREVNGNYERAKIRSRVEHVFGVQVMRAGSLLIRTIGLIRAKTKIGLRNLACNIDRYCLLATA